MQNWRKNRNFRKRENADGTFTYTIKVDGEQVEVSKELYHEYVAFDRKMEYLEFDLKRDRVLQDEKGKTVRDEHGLSIYLPEREVSLDKLIEEDWEFPSAMALPEEVLIKAVEIEELRHCITLLDKQEQLLIQAIVYGGMTEAQYASQIGVSQPYVSKQYKAIRAKLKKYLIFRL